MSELKRIRVREAKIKDIGLFRKLWLRLLEEQSKRGSLIKISQKTINFYENLFNLYIDKQYKGIVLFVADRGILMAGDYDHPLDCNVKPIMNWGCYAESEQEEDIKQALWDYFTSWAKENKFTGILSDKYEGLELLEGFKPISTLMYKEL